MRASRLLSILMLLQLRGRLTAEYLAAEFEVSVRTIYRDIDELSASGVPVYADRGPGGGFALLDGYRTRLTGLAAGEAEALFMIGLPGPAAALGLGAQATMAANKLRAALPASLSRDADRIWSRFHLDPLAWYRATEPVPQLADIARAVWEEKVVEMRYEAWAGLRDWHIEPLGLVLKAGEWYVAGARDGRTRIFKIVNIVDYTVLDQGFTRPPDFDLGAFWEEQLARFERDLRTDTARLRASALGRKRLAKLGAYAAGAVANAASPDESGWAEFDFPLENLSETPLLLLGIGPEVEVLSPPELRAALHDLAASVAGLAKPIESQGAVV